MEVFDDTTSLRDEFGGLDDQSDVTERADLSTEEGLAYYPPTDPPLTPDGREVIQSIERNENSGSIELLPGSQDADLEDGINAALLQNSSTAGLDLNIVSRGGVVYMRGAVADALDADNAEQVIRNVPGVVDVEDQTIIDAETAERLPPGS
jgi:hypothetical protein